ncbi:hypothetical protein HA052_19725 [Chromobacterium haemolyticum]|uniref:Uncharacterized protein n=1 Tax=Chromobacterium fluminis TaxID=3044269 RepID=A0ABX0LD15_9NEIS|nr:hypothetical protein [Chromobacterium haemolyticum]NHR07424.1 hypothetical protein [Chromobacterium haemolyticum]
MTLKALFSAARAWIVGPHAVGVMRGLYSDIERDKALDVLAQNGLAAHYYLPAVGVADRELAAACRELAGCGYLIVDRYGDLQGKVAAARPTSDEIAQERRAAFRIVKLADTE